jgi:transcriptional/translational regulatory protein YebC/TACO1
MVPTSTIAVEETSAAKRVLQLIDALDDNDDVQDVFANFDISDELLESIEA